MRSRNYITTYTGKQFSPLNPDPDAIDIRDIAHAISRIGRANGHFVEFYPVGQHCLDCAAEAMARGYSARQVLACLLHDASEAYVSDITSPVKKHLRQYIQVEDQLLDVIYQKYLPGGIRPREQRAVKEIDNAMLYYEFVHFMGQKFAEVPPKMETEPCFHFSSFQSVEDQYLYLFHYLTRQIQEEVETPSYTTLGMVPTEQGWLTAVLTEDGCQLLQTGTVREICQHYQDADAVLTSVPVGLPEDVEDDALRPEPQLRRWVQQVAAVPCRQAVQADSDAAARQENQRVLGRTLSPQMMALRAAIAEMDSFILNQNDWKNVLRQSHPQLLGKAAAVLLEQYQQQIQASGHKYAAQDAICLAMIGQLECREGSVTIPAQPYNDAKGIAMQVVAPKQIGQ